MNRLCFVVNNMATRAIEVPDRSTSRAANSVHVLSIGTMGCGSVVHDALIDGPHFHLTIATELRKLWLVPKQESMQLVILHHTLSESEMEDARWFVHEWWPHARIMVIRPHAGLFHLSLFEEHAAHCAPTEALFGTIERAFWNLTSLAINRSMLTDELTVQAE